MGYVSPQKVSSPLPRKISPNFRRFGNFFKSSLNFSFAIYFQKWPKEFVRRSPLTREIPGSPLVGTHPLRSSGSLQEIVPFLTLFLLSLQRAHLPLGTVCGVGGCGASSYLRNTTDFKPSNIVHGAESVAQDISQAKPLTNLKDGWNQSLRKYVLLLILQMIQSILAEFLLSVVAKKWMAFCKGDWRCQRKCRFYNSEELVGGDRPFFLCRVPF